MEIFMKKMFDGFMATMINQSRENYRDNYTLLVKHRCYKLLK